MFNQFKNRLKTKGIFILKSLIFKAKANSTLKKILHPVLIKVPYLNRVLSYLKNKISPAPTVIGPLITSPSKIQDLTPLGQKIYYSIQQELRLKVSNENTD
jgi:hypothetical protein